MPPTVRDLIRGIQKEIRESPDLLPDRAAELLMQLSALIGNVGDEIRICDALFAQVLLGCLNSEKKANRARIMAEITPEYQRRQEARDLKELLLELIRSLKLVMRVKSDELRYAGGQQ